MGDDEMRTFGTGLFDRWTALWNGELGLADEIMAPDFVLRYAQAGTDAFDEIRTPQQLARIVAGWHESHAGLRFAAEGTAVVDLTPADGAPTGLVARPYHASFAADGAGKVARSGVDILRVSDGLIVEVWSVSSGAAGRTFYR
ncbi:nuclear transport factor 2 family protein [Kitasatospora sp. NBC_00458]|uniref:nuclear transport factor 2 family protein n=1 Tax=Kitasatospora sp. NBC_00458 TaxID=2903568 RepID=UPI002E1747DB